MCWSSGATVVDIDPEKLTHLALETLDESPHHTIIVYAVFNLCDDDYVVKRQGSRKLDGILWPRVWFSAYETSVQ